MTEQSTAITSGGARTYRALLPVLLALLTATFWWTGRWFYIHWTATNSYYTHGPLIPLVSAWLLYRNRRHLAAAPLRPFPMGLCLVIPSLLLHMLATAWQVGFLSGFALVGTLAGLVLTLAGPAFFRAALFPLAFLLFMVPLPDVAIEKLSFTLKLMSARAAVGVLDVFGFAAVRQGSRIQIPNGTLIVDDICSGLKYLISLMAFAALYAHICSLKKWQKGVLFLMSVPIAFLANAARVFLMVVVADYKGVETAEEWYFHDLFGFVLFVVAFLLMFLLESIFRMGTRADPADAPAIERAKISFAGAPSRRLRGGLYLGVGLCALLSTWLTWPRPTLDNTGALAAVPLALDDWQGADLHVDDHVYDVLGTRDVLTREYRNPEGRRVGLTVVLARQTRRRTHPPEQCFVGDGYTLTATSQRETPLTADQAPLRVQELVFTRGDSRIVTWYFFKSGNKLSTSYWRHQIGVAFSKLAYPDSADVLVRVDSYIPEGESGIEQGRAALDQFLKVFAHSLIGKLP